MEGLRHFLREALRRMPPRLRGPVEMGALRIYENYLVYRAGDDGQAVNGLALPPAAMRVQVIGAADSATFLDSGNRQTLFIRSLLQRHGLVLDKSHTMLDFGCGCGRLARWWNRPDDAPLYGCDVNRKLIQWCRTELPSLNATATDNDPPLPYIDSSFDFVYAMSIFSHLPMEQAVAWMAELRRILKPDGHLMFTTLGLGHFDRLNHAEQAGFQRGEEIVQFDTASGSNLCLAYHPPEFVAREMLSGLTLVDSVLCESPGINPRSASTQDCYLVRNSAT